MKELLADGWLIAATVNSRTLNHKPGFSGCVVVVLDFDGKNDLFRIHDPGLPAHESWQVSYSDLDAAFSYVGPKNAALAAVKI